MIRFRDVGRYKYNFTPGGSNHVQGFPAGRLIDVNRHHIGAIVVESPADVIAVEESGGYRGRYFVLLGRLSPLDGIGPDALGMDLFENQIAAGTIREIILATSATVEGEATAGYLASLARKHRVAATRIAHGVPIGGELEYVDSNTLSRAFSGRRAVDPD